jgi:hypothetical protein
MVNDRYALVAIAVKHEEIVKRYKLRIAQAQKAGLCWPYVFLIMRAPPFFILSLTYHIIMRFLAVACCGVSN